MIVNEYENDEADELEDADEDYEDLEYRKQKEKKETISNALTRLNRYLVVRDRAESEILDYLRRKRLCPSEYHEEILEYLRGLGLLDDLRFARNRLEYRRGKGYGPMYIRNELRSFKVDGDFVNLVLEEAPEHKFLESALTLARRKGAGRSEEGKDERADQKLRNSLRSRGFTGEQIQRVLRRLEQPEEEWELEWEE